MSGFPAGRPDGGGGTLVVSRQEAVATDSTGLSPPIRLTLLGGFRVHVGDTLVPVPTTGARMLAVLALGTGGEKRSTVAGLLWPDKSEGRAAANLRSAVWRIPEPVRQGVESTAQRLSLRQSWTIDVLDAHARARSLLDNGDADVADSAYRADLLPDWDEEWLLIERERYRQLRIHVLEAMAERHLRAGRWAAAVDTALAAAAAEPLRESAQCLVIRAELGAGNTAAALRRYREFAQHLRMEIGVAPTDRLRALLGALTPTVD